MYLRSPLRALCVLVALVVAVAVPDRRVQAQESAGEPELVEMDVRPVLRNVAEAERLLDRFYPPLLKEAEIEGVVGVWIRIDELGRVRETRLHETSGYMAMDDAAERVASLMSFEPAARGGAPIPVWIPMDITFRLDAPPRPEPAEAERPERTERLERMERPERTERMQRAERPERPERLERTERTEAPERVDRPESPDADVSAEPQFTPMTVQPQLQNGAQVEAALQEHYPPVLRDAGIGGRVGVWLFIDETGVVRDTRLNEGSGYDAFDSAALDVARVMRFSPAENRGTPVPVWVSIGINFEVGGGGR